MFDKYPDSDRRVIAWFSAGAASAVATKLAINDYGDRVVVASIDPGSEHPDNERFVNECEEWFGRPVTRLKSDRYEDTWEVFEKTKYLVGPTGARCTSELKKRPRFSFQEPDDIQVFGYTSEEGGRAERFAEQNPGIDLDVPLIRHNVSKADCLALISKTGIELPMMYALGYRNNNCVGCVKGGMGYWNKIRVDFPEVFDRMARLERKLGNTVVRVGGKPVYLDELDPSRGRYSSEDAPECGVVCQEVAVEIQVCDNM